MSIVENGTLGVGVPGLDFRTGEAEGLVTVKTNVIEHGLIERSESSKRIERAKARRRSVRPDGSYSGRRMTY